MKTKLCAYCWVLTFVSILLFLSSCAKTSGPKETTHSIRESNEVSEESCLKFLHNHSIRSVCKSEERIARCSSSAVISGHTWNQVYNGLESVLEVHIKNGKGGRCEGDAWVIYSWRDRRHKNWQSILMGIDADAAKLLRSLWNIVVSSSSTHERNVGDRGGGLDGSRHRFGVVDVDGKWKYIDYCSSFRSHETSEWPRRLFAFEASIIRQAVDHSHVTTSDWEEFGKIVQTTIDDLMQGHNDSDSNVVLDLWKWAEVFSRRRMERELQFAWSTYRTAEFYPPGEEIMPAPLSSDEISPGGDLLTFERSRIIRSLMDVSLTEEEDRSGRTLLEYVRSLNQTLALLGVDVEIRVDELLRASRGNQTIVRQGASVMDAIICLSSFLNIDYEIKRGAIVLYMKQAEIDGNNRHWESHFADASRIFEVDSGTPTPSGWPAAGEPIWRTRE